jgi:hypothetical protein
LFIGIPEWSPAEILRVDARTDMPQQAREQIHLRVQRPHHDLPQVKKLLRAV